MFCTGLIVVLLQYVSYWSDKKKKKIQSKIVEDVNLLFRLEAAKDDYRIHCEELEKQLIEVQHRNDELTSLAEESRALKDELDVLRFVFIKKNYGRRSCSR